MEQALLSFVLASLGRPALKAAAGIGLAIVVALAFAISSLGVFFVTASPGYPIAGARPAEIPPDQLPVIRAAAVTCGLPWPVLAEVAKIESDFGRNMATSTAGAIGYGQFMPGTWEAYGNGGDPYDYHDALPAMARYLCANGAPQDLKRAIFAYNHDDSYVDSVLAIAVRYGYLAPGEPNGQVVNLARAQSGVPYVWGGRDPETGFDCSGLTQWAYGQVGLTLPRTAQAQFEVTVRLTRDELQPGDLVFFRQTYPSLDPITHVGLYAGNGLMINAPAEGEVVQETPVFEGFWGEHYAGAGRVRQ